jgi:hypothetical protein
VTASPARAAQSCIDRFAGKTYEPGKRDCAILAAHLLHQRGIAVPAMKGRKYRTEAGAIRAMRAAGYHSLVEAIDALGLERIAPAAARTGDLIGMPCEGPWGCALTVAVGNGRVFGFLDGVAQVQIPSAFTAAWRV